MALILLAWLYLGRPADALDLSLQRSCEQALGDRPGAIVALDPRDGRVLALINPDLAVRQTRPPGSLIKLLIAYTAVSTGITDEHRSIPCWNGKRFGRERRFCWRQPGHGPMTLIPAIANSCNIYFLTLGHELGAGRLAHSFALFGLGVRTGIDLSGEANGRVPQPRRLAELLDMAIGEGATFSVTPLQMAAMIAAFANGGTLYRPYLDGQVGKTLRHLSTGARERQALAYVREGMRQAVLRGNAVRAAVRGLSVAGKTGTSSLLDGSKRTHAWFAGYAPAESPLLVLAVFLEKGTGFGDAAPLARSVFAAWQRRRADRGRV